MQLRIFALLFCVLLTVFVAMTLGTLAQTIADSSNWPMYHNDAAHTGYSDTPTPTSAPQLWKCTIDTEPVTIPGSPAIVDGRVYLGSADGNVYCLLASDGSKVWNYTTEYNSNGPAHGYSWGNAVSDPAVAGGYVYVGSSDFKIYCLKATSGSYVWNYTTNAEVYSAPAVADGLVFVGSYDGNAYCLNATDGVEVWNYQVGTFSPVNAAGSAGSSSIADGVVYVVGNGVLYALGTSSTATALPSYLNAIIIVAVFVVAAVVAVVLLKRKHQSNPNRPFS
jgi:outer membrane protein assembly factor BamB